MDVSIFKDKSPLQELGDEMVKQIWCAVLLFVSGHFHKRQRRKLYTSMFRNHENRSGGSTVIGEGVSLACSSW